MNNDKRVASIPTSLMLSKVFTKENNAVTPPLLNNFIGFTKQGLI